MGDRGTRARRALIEAAEQLFAERGIESVSLRDISAAAGQRNHSAAQYHFDDRAGLVAAVFSHRMSIVNDRRYQLLDELEASDRADHLDSLVGAAVTPLVGVVAETDGWYGRFLVRVRWDVYAREVLVGVPELASFRRLLDLLDAALAERLPGSQAARRNRLEQMTTLLIGTIAGWEWQRAHGRPVVTAEQLCDDLTATCTAVLTAPAAVTAPAPATVA